MKSKKSARLSRILILLILCITAASVIVPLTASAEEKSYRVDGADFDIVLSENGASDDIYGTPSEVFEHILIIITAVARTIPHSPQSPPTIIKMNLGIEMGG